jgi:translation initiation factor IF-2
MRVYEFAKLLNLTNKELLALLSKEGIEVKSHMATLSPEVIDLLQKKLTKPKQVVKDKAEELEIKEIGPQRASAAQPMRLNESKSAPIEKKEEPSIKIEPVAVQEFEVKSMTVGEIAQVLKKPVSEIILLLLKQGIVCAKNQILSEKIVEQLARHFQCIIKYPQETRISSDKAVAKPSEGAHRLPVVVILGHVDHGKTTLLDFIRKTRVAAREKGGITQHLGAYQATTPEGDVVFLDTPGHAAFSNIRGRGVTVADIAVLLVAVDDGIMPQTVESIQKAQQAGIPIIVALNKIDKVEKARIESVKRDLTKYGLVAEEWGGDTICVPISAKTGQGVDQLLELLVLQSQLMDLKADDSKPAKGFILESKFEKGRGAVATIICHQGILRIGDYFMAGHTFGRVTSLLDSYGKNLKEVRPSVPIQVAGFSELAKAGDVFEVVSEDKYRTFKTIKSPQVSSLKKIITEEDSIKLIIKTDTSSTQEALLDSLNKLMEKSERSISIIYHGIGDISESDVVLATDTGADIIGLHVKVEPNAVSLARKDIITIKLFDIIYKLLEDVQERAKKAQKVNLVTKKIGEASILKVFAIKNVGTVAGAYLKEGRFARDGKVIIWRGKKKVGEGKIKSLERDRKSVKEVHAGFEFAFLVDGFDTWEIDDRVECYLEVPEK